MKNLVSVLLVIMAVPVLAQRMDVNAWGEEQSFAQAYFFVGGASNTVSSEFLNAITGGDTLSQSILNNQFNQLKNEGNTIGADYESALRLKLGIFKSGALLVKVADAAHLDVSFDKNLFGLGFYGNAPFAGDTLTMSPAHLNYYRFQQFGLGYSHKVGDGVEVFGMISGINGNRAMNAGLYRSKVYTNDFGDTIYSDVFASGLMSDSKFSNGGGMAVSVGLVAQVNIANQVWSINASLENMGIVQWNLNTTTFEIDTQLLYTGVNLTNLNQDISAEIERQIQDSIAQGFNGIVHSNWRNTTLPGYAQVTFNKITDSGLSAAFGATVRRNSVYNSFGWLNAGYKWKSGFDARLEVGYGGYRKLQIGASFNYETESLKINLRASNFESLLSSVKGVGLTCFVGLQYNFEL